MVPICFYYEVNVGNPLMDIIAVAALQFNAVRMAAFRYQFPIGLLS